jgi:hypothetical protein
MTLILLVILVALVFEYVNGFHDTANSIATVVSTKVLTRIFHKIFAKRRANPRGTRVIRGQVAGGHHHGRADRVSRGEVLRWASSGAGRRCVLPHQVEFASIQQFPLYGLARPQPNGRSQGQGEVDVEAGLLALGADGLNLQGIDCGRFRS